MSDAAEILTQARLNCWGYPTVKSSQGVFDLIVDLKSSFLKIQVKGTSVITPKMTFEIRRSSMRAGPRRFSYKEGEFDIAALVSIPDQRVLFTPEFTTGFPAKENNSLKTEMNLRAG